MALVQTSLKIERSLLRTLIIQAGKFSMSRQALVIQYLSQGVQAAEESHPGISKIVPMVPGHETDGEKHHE